MSGPCPTLTVKSTSISLTTGDITQQTTDAIVNAANSSLMGGGGVDGAIHRAGGPVILEQCKLLVARQGILPPGKAVATIGGRLKAKYVIHAVGPIWHGGGSNEPETLASAYRESLKVATHYALKSVSFPSISTGAYRYPLAEAAAIALRTVADFLSKETTTLSKVVFVLFDAGTYEAYCSELRKMSVHKG